ncbi:ABC-2 family transporter protein [Actinomadura rubteroloni]|uniref:ABC-2 family transporter protein n=1 Tax=Actinomadura rubteroloni TaxID=1926885 RepID=A0A2P4UDS3_9ACTN|nr:ABC transporter permease [Actinomadura rubteroloni]POM23194.1 ABC-2 family transporter protein [Actinomadura rubteroloni]
MATSPAPSEEARAPAHHAVDAAPAPPGATGLKGILLPVGIVLAIGAIFVSVFLAAFHAPRPHDLPVAVVGTAAQAGQVANGLERALPGGFEVKRYADADAARRAVQDRTVYAAYVPGSGKADELLYAGANGPSVTSTVSGAFSGLTAARGRRLTEHDVVPAVAGDTRGMSVFYAGFGIVLAGFLFGLMTYQVAPRLEYRWRMASLSAFSVLGGVLVALLTGSLGFAALPGPFLGIATIIALMAAAVGGATMVFLRLFGRAGMSLAAVVLLTFGNSTSGGTLPTAYLPGWLRPLSEILPVGVGVRAIQGLSHFDNDGVVVGVTVLTVWIALTAAILYWRDARA